MLAKKVLPQQLLQNKIGPQHNEQLDDTWGRAACRPYLGVQNGLPALQSAWEHMYSWLDMNTARLTQTGPNAFYWPCIGRWGCQEGELQSELPGTASLERELLSTALLRQSK